jgi:hypothetical protein
MREAAFSNDAAARHAMIRLRAMAAAGCGALIALIALPCAAQDAALQQSLGRWRAAGLVDYEYGYRKYCDCHPEAPPETVVTVRSGEVVGVRHRPVGYPEDVPADPKNLQFYWTIDGLFALLESALDRGAAVRASYDEALGYPTQLYIDYDPSFIGDELDLRLTRVAAIAP